MATRAKMLRMEPVRREGLASQIIERLKAYIVEHDLGPGARLPTERDLVGTLGVSRNVLREALKSLDAVGLIEIRVGDGTYVSEFDYSRLAGHVSFAISRSERKLQDFVEARRTLELGALDVIAARIDECALDRLTECNRRLENASSPEEALAADLEFHTELLSIPGNPILSEFGLLVERLFVAARETAGWDAAPGEAEVHRQLIESLRREGPVSVKGTVGKRRRSREGVQIAGDTSSRRGSLAGIAG